MVLILNAAVILTSELIRDYLLNYARSLIYTTALSYAQIISVDCSFDLLEDGTAKRVRRILLRMITHPDVLPSFPHTY